MRRALSPAARFPLLLGVVLGCVLAAHPGRALAWEPLDSCGGGAYTAWVPGSPDTVWKYASSLPSDDFTVAETLQVLTDSFDEWGVPGCSSFTVEQGPNTSADPMDYNSDRAVGFYESYFPSSLGSALAVTFPSWDWDCEMSDASMVFNGADYTWTAGAWGNDLQSVATHEAGHWVGLDHSWASDSTMTAYYNGGTGDRVLDCDDTEAICSLYPSGGTACGAPGGDDYCPCGQSCVGGWCEGTPSGAPWGSGDDDDTGSPGDDDDTSSPGDDDTGSPPEGCTGPLETYVEVEPNGGDGVYHIIEGSGGDLAIEAEIWCANDGEEWSGDIDWFHVQFPCADQARFTVDWSGGSSDLDFWVYDENPDLIAENEDEDYQGPVTEQGYVDGGLYFGVACWSGPSLSYRVEVDFAPWGMEPPGEDGEPSPGDDDSSPGDDDSTSGHDGSSTENDSTDAESLEPAEGEDPPVSPGENSEDEGYRSMIGCGCRVSEPGSDAAALALWMGLAAAALRRLRHSPEAS